ncbi:hypothetical protein LJC49_07110 [Ruminococcaceae bacterium OttesenSCG-928-I18]|nr:hypothetical protein [Ruminococcaceae bacterium OttesenSCG-928-I18]
MAWMEAFKAEREQEFTEWFNAKKTEFDSWFSSFTTTNTTRFNTWYNTFTTASEAEFSDWFENLQNQLDDNQAANLQNQINHHLANGINSEVGVHSLRYYDGKLQAYIGTGWVTVGQVARGLSWTYIEETLAWTWGELDILQKTWEDIENMIEEEAA